jgi:hypothetical protein
MPARLRLFGDLGCAAGTGVERKRRREWGSNPHGLATQLFSRQRPVVLSRLTPPGIAGGRSGTSGSATTQDRHRVGDHSGTLLSTGACRSTASVCDGASAARSGVLGRRDRWWYRRSCSGRRCRTPQACSPFGAVVFVLGRMFSLACGRRYSPQVRGWSDRPGSNRRHQLGRLRSCH